MQRRPFEQRQQTRPAIERDLVDLALNQQGIDVEAPGQVLDIDKDLRVFNSESAGWLGNRVAIFLLGLEQAQAPGFPGDAKLPQVHLLQLLPGALQ
ncbi:hypothetical protein D3C73_1098890 [compost metagenome]